MTFDEWNNPETHPESRSPTARVIWDAAVASVDRQNLLNQVAALQTLNLKLEAERDELRNLADQLAAALSRIKQWHGEFPSTGRTWDDGTPMSYGACWGSNGERDFMRQIATNILDAYAAWQQRTGGKS